MTDEKDNPFSFKKFVKDTSLDLNVEELEDDKTKNSTNSDDNPFSFKAFVGFSQVSEESQNIPQDLPKLTNEPGLDLPQFDDSHSTVEFDFTSDAQTAKCDFDISAPLFSDNVDHKTQTSHFSTGKDLAESDESDSDSDFTSQSVLSIELNNQSVESVDSMKRSNLMTELNNAKELLKSKEERISHLKSQISLLQKKEKEETSALEEVIHKVEANLKLCTERALKAEKLNGSLSEKVKQQQSEIEKLKLENGMLRGRLDSVQYKETMKYVSEQLKVAANGAKVSLDQLLSGVNQLHQLSEILHAADITELKQDCDPQHSS